MLNWHDIEQDFQQKNIVYLIFLENDTFIRSFLEELWIHVLLKKGVWHYLRETCVSPQWIKKTKLYLLCILDSVEFILELSKERSGLFALIAAAASNLSIKFKLLNL